MPNRRGDGRISESARRVIFFNATSGDTLPFGLMRPLLPPKTWEQALNKLDPTSVKPGIWFTTKMPLEWVLDGEAIKQAESVGVGDWSGVLKMTDHVMQLRLQEGSASKALPVDLNAWGPFHKNFGVKILSLGVQAALRREAAVLGTPDKDIERLTLGQSSAPSRYGEITRGLTEACRTTGNYLGPLCVVSTAPPPTAA